MKHITIIAILLVITGCATVKKRERRARSFYVEYPDKLASLATTLFPSQSIYKAGRQVAGKADTVLLKGDTVFINVDCPDGTKIPVKYVKGDTVKMYIPILQVDTIEKPNTVELNHWKSEERKESEARIKAETALAVSKQESNNKTWWIIGLGLLSGLTFAGLVYKSITNTPNNLLSKILKK